MTSPPLQATESGAVPSPHWSTATRHLSVGAFVDETFSSIVVRRVLDQSRRPVAADRFDPITVLGQCRRALRLHPSRDWVLGRWRCALRLNSSRDWILTGAIAAGAHMVDPAPRTLLALIGLQLVVSGTRLLREAARQTRHGSRLDPERIKAQAITLFAGFIVAAAVNVVIFMLALVVLAAAATAEGTRGPGRAGIEPARPGNVAASHGYHPFVDAAPRVGVS